MDTHESTRSAPTPPPGLPPTLLAAIGNDEDDQIVTAIALQAARLWPGGSLHLVHVIDVLPVAEVVVASSDWSYPGIDTLRRQGSDYLQRFTLAAGEALGRAVPGHLLFGAPVAQIVELANRLRATLLVVGTREVSSLTRLLMGSTARALLHKAPCSVLLARVPKYDAKAQHHASEVCPACLEAEATSCGATRRCVPHALAYGRTHGDVGAVGREAS